MKNFLEAARKAYYEGDPILSDAQYDALERKYGELSTPGYILEDGIPHYSRMFSLQKFYEGEAQFPSWYTNSNIAKVDTPKLDGAAISLLYVQGNLVQVLTRGDGYKGTDITHLFDNSEKIGIPSKIPVERLPVHIMGEVVAPKTIPNARNYASGALSLKSKEEFYKRNITFVAYEAYPQLDETYIAAMEKLNNYGFDTVLHTDSSIFPTDGRVIRVDSYAKYEGLGFTSKHPKGAFALKERTEGVVTVILDVVWQTGKTGKVTPVAILEPIEIEGAVVSRATLNNVGFIQALNLELGDEVLVERSGGIIPRIISKA